VRRLDDGRIEITSIIERQEESFYLKPSDERRNAYLQKVKASKSQGDARRFYTVITNRNEFSIKAPRSSVVSMKPNRIATTTRIENRAHHSGRRLDNVSFAAHSEKQSMTCRVTDFLKSAPTNSADRRLRSDRRQSSYSRLRQDAIRVGVSVDILVEPFITIAGTLLIQH